MFAFILILILITLTLFINSALTMTVVKSPTTKIKIRNELLIHVIVIIVISLMAFFNFDMYTMIIPKGDPFYLVATIILGIITALPICFIVCSFLTLINESEPSVVDDKTTSEKSSSGLSEVVMEGRSQDNREWLDKLHSSLTQNQNNP